MPQPQPRQQSRLNDIEMLQRQIMVRKLQELQRQQQIQQLGDDRQHNHMNQQYTLNKQNSRDQFPHLINGTPISDTSQRFMTGNINLMHPGVSSVVQGFSNETGFPQPQGHALTSMSLVSQHDASLYGTPVPGVGNNMGRYSQLLGATQSLENTYEKGNNNQQSEPITQSSSYRNPLSSHSCDASSNQIGMQEESLTTAGEYQEKNLFRQVPAQALHGSFQQLNRFQRSTSDMESGRRQEQAGWPGQYPEKVTNIGPSQDLCSLDPLEQKILFNTDDNSWDASFGSSSNIRSEVLNDPIENTDHIDAFPSLQSGSWSALMQSAVAETSSSDAGLREEWSGLSFQNSELSTDNWPSNITESGKHHPDWVENGLQTVSASNSKPEFQNLNMTSSFPGFQQPGIQFPFKQKDGVHLETSQESNQQHSTNNNNNKWLDCNSLQKQIVEGNQQGQRLSFMQSGWPEANNEQAERVTFPENMSMYPKGTQAGGDSGSQQVRSDNVYAKHPVSAVTESYKLHCGNDTNGSVEDGRTEYVGKSQYHRSSSPQICNNTYNGASRYEKQPISERVNTNDSYYSNASQHAGHDLKQNVWQHNSDSRHIADSNQRASGQVLHRQNSQESRGYELGYAEQFKFNGNVSSNDSDLEKRRLPSIQRNLTEHVSPKIHDNMVDTSKNYPPGMRVGSRDSAPFSEVPRAGSPDAFATQSYNKPFLPQTFGLRLSPPSQRTPVSNCFDVCHGSPKRTNGGDTVSLGPSVVRNQLTPQVDCQSYGETQPGVGSSQDNPSNIYSHQLPVSEANPVTQHFVSSGMSQQVGFPMLWRNTGIQQNTSATEPLKVSFSKPLSSESNNDFVTASIAPQVLHYESNYKGQKESGKFSMNSEGSGSGVEQAPKEAYSQLDSSGTFGPVPQNGKVARGLVANGVLETDSVGRVSLMTNSNQQTQQTQQTFDWPPRNVNQKQNVSDLEVFGSSLEPPPISSQSYSLLQQVQMANKSGCDPDLSVQPSNVNVGQRLFVDSSNIQNTVNNEPKSVSQTNFHLIEEHKLQKLSSELRENQSAKSLSQPFLQDANQETATFGQYSSQSASDAAEQSQISLQMAPSWFKHYGTLRNGQMLPMFDQRAAHQFSPENMLAKLNMGNTGACRDSSVWPTAGNNLEAVKSSTPSYVLPPDVHVPGPEIIKPKKRKYAAFEVSPWHKETSECSNKLHSASLSAMEWAEATNRLVEKVEDEAGTTESSLAFGPKKRLALTTQLMQNIFQPPPSVIFGRDATLNCETVAYCAARSALSDACCLKSSYNMASNISDTLSEKLGTPKPIGDQNAVKVVEDFLALSTKLEADFLILEKSASITDVRVESQELEKFSMINHFAKFHSRGPAGAADASTSSGSKRLFLQRYVKPVPMPRTVPEGAQCLSL